MKISEEKRIPLIPIHHMEAHALVGRMQQRTNFPFLCLLISGGHNLLLIVHAIGIYTQIGTTIDDSLGKHATHSAITISVIKEKLMTKWHGCLV